MSVQTTLALQDKLTGPLLKMMKAMDSTIKIMEKMDNTANSVDMKGLAKARSTIQSASADMERLKSAASTAGDKGVNNLKNSFTGLPGPIDNATSSVRSFFTGFVGAAAAYLSLQAIADGFRSFVSAADTYVSTNARLENINDGLQTQAELQEKIYQAAQRSRTGYNDLASSVAKLNLLAADAFSGNDEAIKFGELMGKAFTVSGASTQERQAGMYQLTQAMAAGKLQGDEFRSIMENAPMLAKAISKATGVSMGALKDMSAEGTITADIIKTALFRAADDIEEKFKNMPMTFSQAWMMFKNWSLTAFEPLFIRFSEFVNSDAFGVLAGQAMMFIGAFTGAMDLFFDLLEWGYTELGALGQLIADGWGLIGPYLIVAGAALVSYLSILTAYRTVLFITTALETARAFALGVTQAAMMLAAGATFTATAAQWGLNAAIWAFPGTWILAAFIGVIALVVSALYFWGDSTATVVGAIVGSIAWMGTAFYNTLLFMANLGIAAIEWIYNSWNQGVFGIQSAFFAMGQMIGKTMEIVGVGTQAVANQALGGISDVVNAGISGLNKLISLANNIPNVNIKTIGKVDFKAGKSVVSSIGSSLRNIPMPKQAPTSLKLGRFDYKDLSQAFNVGNAVGKTISKGASNAMHGLVDQAKGLLGGKGMAKNPYMPDPNALGNMLTPGGGSNPLGGDGKNPTGGKLDSIGKIDDEINISDEDLKMLKELADIRSIQNFKSLQPSFTFTGDIAVREEADIEKIVSKISESLTNSMNESVEGAYV